MSLLLDLLLFAAGLALLLGGASALVTGGSRIAGRLGVAPVVVGLTVVAFGTSAPELVVSLVAALRGSSGLMLGNVIGSNLANIGLILGLAAVISPVAVDRHLLRLEVPLLLLGTALFAGLLMDSVLGRLDGLALTVLFAVFMVLTLRSAQGGGVARSLAADARAATPSGHGLPASAALAAVGIVALAGGGQLVVGAATRTALRLGASETLIGLTLVAVGTSLPELATTLVAAARRHGDLALGNVVGSNLFNLLGVAGPVALIRPVAVPAGVRSEQLPALALMTVLLPLAMLGRRVGRAWGVALLLVYIGLTAWWVRIVH